jgi:hypothetical protein
MIQIRTFTRLVFLVAMTLAVELIGLPQPVTGPFVNLMLVLTTLILNAYAGIILGFVTPLLALLRGQLPALLVPFVPFIMLGNAGLVLGVALLTRHSSSTRPPLGWRPWAGVTAGALLKFAWLFLSARHLVPLLFARPLPQALVAMMTFPQLITALSGGFLAILFHAILVRRRIIKIAPIP